VFQPLTIQRTLELKIFAHQSDRLPFELKGKMVINLCENWNVLLLCKNEPIYRKCDGKWLNLLYVKPKSLVTAS